MKLRLLFLTFLFSTLSWGQTTIAVQDFDGGTPNWNYTSSHTPYNVSGDIWDIVSANSDPASGTSGDFWGIRDLNNPNGGGSTYHELTFDDIDITAYTSVVISFRYYTVGFDAADEINYKLAYDGGSFGALVDLNKDTSGNWSTVTINVPGGTTSARIQLRATQDGGSDYAGFDDIKIEGTPSGPITYSVTYDGNGNDSGSVPTDGNAYSSGDSVTVLGNTGSLGLTGYTFNGWNTAADGSGTSYVASDTFTITANTTLYAQWLSTSPPVITSSLTDSGTVGAAYTYNIVATNSPTSYSATGLPAGLSINTTTGEITGTVGTAGVYNIDITATNAYGSDTQTLVVTFTVGPCHVEAMDNLCVSSCSPATSSYATRTWVGDGGTWTATDSRSDQVITGGDPAITIRNGDITSPTFTDGIESITMTTNLPFSDSAGDLDVKVNGVVIGTIPYSTSVQTSTISGININGSVVITIESVSGARVTIDDIEWTCYNVDNEIDVEGNSVSIVSGDTTPSTTDDTDFGSTLVGVDVSHTFTITNAGPDDLDISGITITGVDAADFYISVNPGSTVAAGGSTTFEVTFSPTVAGTSNATINIANNDSDENPYTFDIVAVSTVCVPTTSVSSITPASGPAGTVVTINGSGFATATSVSFGAYAATYTVISGSVIEAVVPAGAASGDIIIEDAGCELSFPTFTVVKEDNTDCEGIAVTTDLIIYDLHDEYTGNGGFITIYNGTASDVDLTNYTLWRTSNYGDGNEIDYANLTGILASGDLGVIRVNTAGCGPVGTNGTIDNGFNGDDQIQLRDATGTVVIDDVHTYFDKGYYMVRNTGALSARTSYVAADWSITPLGDGECWPSAGLVPPSGSGSNPSVTLNPVDVNAGCPSTTATLTVAGSEGVVGGLGLAYQWYVNVPGNAGWTAVTNGGVYSGATSATLDISSTSGLNNYQYYCQIREDSATCYVATEAAMIKDGATVWDGSSWSNGVPDISKTATIDGDYDTAIDGSFSCCSLVVNATYTLDIQANDYVEIQNNLTVNGTLNVWDDGSLVQVDDAGVNTGDISYERITTGVALDYVYWSSPVDGVNTPATGYIYAWDADFANPNSGWGYWILSRNTAMDAGVGYIMRDVFTRTFTGVARNGVIQPSISRANYTGADFTGTNGITITNKDDNWNLIGNPYPSAISALDFLTLNTNIEGAVRIWTHGTTPSTAISDPVYDDYSANYTVADYIVHNGTGTISGPAGFNGLIAGGQSFMVNMNDGAAATETVTFNNSMRDKNHNNEQFYRQSANSSRAATVVEQNRIWLDISNGDNTDATRTLIGYVTNATNQKDRMYDAVTNALSPIMNIYSLIEEDRMSIQGRSLPFEKEDIVPLGVNINNTGLFTISIGAMDGIFAGDQDVFLEDKELGIIYDLKEAPYSFFANKGEYLDRFVLRYTDNRLSQDDTLVNSDDVLVGTSENSLTVISNKEKIKEVRIHNVLGQLLLNKKNVNSTQFEISSLVKNSQALIVIITLENDKEMVKKVMY